LVALDSRVNLENATYEGAEMLIRHLTRVWSDSYDDEVYTPLGQLRLKLTNHSLGPCQYRYSINIPKLLLTKERHSFKQFDLIGPNALAG